MSVHKQLNMKEHGGIFSLSYNLNFGSTKQNILLSDVLPQITLHNETRY